MRNKLLTYGALFFTLFMFLVMTPSVSAQYAESAPFVNTNSSSRSPESTNEIFDLLFNYDIGAEIGANGNAGVAFVNGQYWISAWASNSIHLLDSDGNFIQTITIPGVTGVRSFTSDGTYVYAGGGSTGFYKIDPVTRTLVSTITLSPTTASRARMLAYDETLDGGNGGFWTADFSSPIEAFSMTGASLAVIPYANHGHAIYGGAVDNISNGGPYLWIYTQGTSSGQAQMLQIELATGTLTGVMYDYNTSGHQPAGNTSIAGGLFISEDVVSGSVAIIGIGQGTPSDQLFALSLGDVLYDYFIYEDGIWTPENPTGVATDTDNILIVNGSAAIGDTDANNVTIMDGASLDVNGVLNVNGNLTIDGDLIFSSGPDYDGQLGLMAGDITGEATIHRYFKNKRSFRMVSSAVNTTRTIHDSWQEAAVSNTDDPAPGYGTHITGSTVDQQNGFDGTAIGNASMYTMDVAAQEFVAVANTDQDSLKIGEPYLLFVRGNRSIDLTDNNASGATVLRATGRLHTGPQVQEFGTLADGDFVMFGNPYQSAVDINSVLASSTDVNTTYYYIYDPTLATHGAYVTVELPTGTNTSNSDANQYLQPGQAAQVASTGGITEIHFEEAHKAPGNFTSSNAHGNSDMLTVQLFTTENFSTGGPVHDSFGMVFAEGNDNDITRADAVKPWNFYENLAIDHEGTFLSLEHRAMPQAEEVYQLYTGGYTDANYTLVLKGDGLEDVSFYLEDRYTGTSTLVEGSVLAYNFAIDQDDPLSVATDRFLITVGERSLGTDNNHLFTDLSLFPNPLNDGTFYINAPSLDGKNVNVSISDMSGREVYASDLDCVTNRIAVSVDETLASGVYLVTLRHGNAESTLRLIRK